MEFDDFQEHCEECRKGEPCDGYHVYVLMLDRRISKNGWFKERNPDYTGTRPCVYVGRTWHLPICRVSQHINCKSGAWKGRKHICYCSGTAVEKTCKSTNRGSSKAKNYNTYMLLPEYFMEHNPQEDEDKNKRYEEMIADDLREAGFGVWEGELETT